GPVVLPDAGAGYPLEGTSRAAASIDECGMAVRPSPVVPTIVELLEPDGDARPRAVAVWGDPGAGKSAAPGELAHLARGHGFVPVAVHVLEPPGFRPLSAGPPLFLIADDTASGRTAAVAAPARVDGAAKTNGVGAPAQRAWKGWTGRANPAPSDRRLCAPRRCLACERGPGAPRIVPPQARPRERRTRRDRRRGDSLGSQDER